MTQTVDRSKLVGTRLPESTFTITREEHRDFAEAVCAPSELIEAAPGDNAHPMYLYLVAHCGMGMPIGKLFALMGTSLEAGVTFGQGDVEYQKPVLVGKTYRVVTEFVDVERKYGHRRGAFDIVTCLILVSDMDDELVGTSRESYVVPA